MISPPPLNFKIESGKLAKSRRLKSSSRNKEIFSNKNQTNNDVESEMWKQISHSKLYNIGEYTHTIEHNRNSNAVG